MTTPTQSPRTQAWQALSDSLGSERFKTLAECKTQKLANLLKFEDTQPGPIRGTDALNRPYFTIRAMYNPCDGMPQLFAVVMFYHNQEWKGHIAKKIDDYEDVFSLDCGFKIPDQPKIFIEKLFAGKYREYSLNI